MKRHSRDRLCVALEDGTFHLQDRQADAVDNSRDVAGNKWVVTDFGEAPPRLLTVESPLAYAELVALRRLRERGEVRTDARILPHWKRSRGANATEIFFTLVEEDIYRPFLERMQDDPDHHLLFPVNTLMAACLAMGDKGRTVAVLFEHGRHVDYLVGTGQRIVGAGRVSTYSEKAVAKQTLVEQVGNELRQLARTTALNVDRLVYLNWLRGVESEVSRQVDTFEFDGLTDKTTGSGWGTGSGPTMAQQLSHQASSWVLNLAQEFKAECHVVKPRYYTLEANEYLITSIPTAVDMLEDAATVASRLELLQYRSQRLLPWLALAAWLLVAVFMAVTFWMEGSASLMETHVRTVVSEGGIQPPEPLKTDRAAAIRFADGLSHWLQAPSFQKILADMSAARRGTLVFDHVRIEFNDQATATIHMRGTITAPFETAKQEHEQFITELRGRGYEITKSELNTDIQSLRVTLDMTRKSL